MSLHLTRYGADRRRTALDLKNLARARSAHQSSGYRHLRYGVRHRWGFLWEVYPK